MNDTGARVARRLVSTVVAVLALATAPAALAATHSQKVDPFASGWSTTTKDSGYCYSAAISTKRADAFRCFQGSYEIMDPCFASPTVSGEVRCVEAPWSRKASVVQLTKPLPAAVAGPASIWAVTLANGGRCTISTGANDSSHGRVVGWQCQNGDLAQGLHSGTTWWAYWQPSSGVAWKHIAVRTLYR